MADQPQYPVVNSDEANYINRFGDPRSPGWQEQNLTTIVSPSGVKFRVNKVAAPAFQGFINEMENEAGYKFRPGDSSSYNLRNITGGSTLSPHAFGVSFDGNSLTNPYGKTLKTDMPADVADRAAKYGLAWGGNFQDNKDPMHFEFVGSGDQKKSMYASTQAPAQPAASGSDQAAATAKLAEAIQAKNRNELTAAQQADALTKFRISQANASTESDKRYAQLQKLSLLGKMLAPQQQAMVNPFATNVTPWAQPMAPPPSPLTSVLPLMQIAAMNQDPRYSNPYDPANPLANPTGTK